jgi:hypothetical protein
MSSGGIQSLKMMRFSFSEVLQRSRREGKENSFIFCVLRASAVRNLTVPRHPRRIRR